MPSLKKIESGLKKLKRDLRIYNRTGNDGGVKMTKDRIERKENQINYLKNTKGIAGVKGKRYDRVM